MDVLLTSSKKELLDGLWQANPRIMSILKVSESLPKARKRLFKYLNNLETHYFNVYSERRYKDMHILERNNAKECIRVLKNVIRSENERLTGTSALKALRKLAVYKLEHMDEVSEGFLVEFIYLFKGTMGESDIKPRIYTTLYKHPIPVDKAAERSQTLDAYSAEMEGYFSRYKVGYDPDVVEGQGRLREKILDFFGSGGSDWSDWRWHLEHVFSDIDSMQSIVALSSDELEGLRKADEYGIPYQVTPYYLSLFDESGALGYDRALRAQVLPSKKYCINVEDSRREGASMDFMDEKSTSPVKGITRRYPQILILKPYNSCPQICVYCQRNWELKGIHETGDGKEDTVKAVKWIRDNPHITEVLVTGGDPLTLDNEYVGWLMGELSSIDHVERIRVGTRTLVTLPYRFDDGLIEILGTYFELGCRDITVMTHFEHPTEFTKDTLAAVERIKRLGVNIYNQQVFTYYNSRRYETCLLRKVLKKSGIDPYYTFNTKGKDETVDYRVPISRIQQERKEESRLLPGLDRTDIPVFNVPRLGKSNLRAWQDHEPVMILPDGRRVYRFYPWESRIAEVDCFIYTDVSIYDYLKRLLNDGEDVTAYNSIWYYF